MSEYKTQVAYSPENSWTTSAAVSTPNYSTYLRSWESSGGDKEGKCKWKTSRDRIWQWADISPLSLWSLLLHSPNRFNLPLNTNSSRLNSDHCHAANLQDWDKYIIHSTHQFGSPLLPVMHCTYLPVSALLFALLSGRNVLSGSFFFLLKRHLKEKL